MSSPLFDSVQSFKLGKYTLRSRLLVGTGKYPSLEIMRDALEASGCQVVTVAVRRVEMGQKNAEGILDYIDPKKYIILPNTAGCFTAQDAVRSARLAREGLGVDWVKLEVLADKKTLLPDPIGTLEAAQILVKDGFQVLCYTSDDPVMARRLDDIGVTSVMPAGSPIGSGQGVLNPNNIRIILETVKCPVIVDAGVGTASDVCLAMELGAEGVLLNTGIAHAKDPVAMARAMGQACDAGYFAARAGRIPKKLYATASSPWEGIIAPTERRLPAGPVEAPIPGE
ncbi:MAG TPA: thiazole synthase [Planctomycetota bacterium]|nr:thiazole synthase [Planctomycetota bacterium]